MGGNEWGVARGGGARDVTKSAPKETTPISHYGVPKVLSISGGVPTWLRTSHLVDFNLLIPLLPHRFLHFLLSGHGGVARLCIYNNIFQLGGNITPPHVQWYWKLSKLWHAHVGKCVLNKRRWGIHA